MLISASYRSKRQAQRGFTLLELMVAMAIFAILAVAGWQVFDSISRSKEQAQSQADVLATLQYGYQQMSRDMAQTVPYQWVPAAVKNELAAEYNTPLTPMNGFTLQNNVLSLVRYADPDPRYATSKILQRVVYRFNDGNLIREQYHHLSAGSSVDINTDTPLTSILVSDVSAGQFQVFTPQPVTQYPDELTLEKRQLAANLTRTPRQQDSQNSDTQNAATQNTASQNTDPENNTSPLATTPTTDMPPMLPRGVSVSFTTPLGASDTPISWTFALNTPPPLLPFKEP